MSMQSLSQPRGCLFRSENLVVKDTEGSSALQVKRVALEECIQFVTLNSRGFCCSGASGDLFLEVRTLADHAFGFLSNPGNRNSIVETLEAHFKVMCLSEEKAACVSLLLLLVEGESGELFALLRAL